jgi:hypothetical protein
VDAVRRLLLLLSLSLVILSCAPPPFNLGLSLSAFTARGLTLEGTVGPIDKNADASEIVDAAFLAETGTPTGLDLQNGFLLFTDSFGVRNLAFVSWNAGKKMYVPTGTGIQYGIAATDPYPDLQVMNLKGASHYVGVFTFSSSAPSNNQFASMQADPAGNQFPGSTSAANLRTAALAQFGSGNVICVSRYPTAGSSSESTYWLFMTSGGTFLEGAAPTDAVTALAPTLLGTRPPTPYSLGASVPTVLPRALYYYDPEPSRAPERSYLSWYDTGKKRWQCWWWSGGVAPTPTELIGVNHRVDAILTTGELFSTEGDTGRVYARDGTLRVQFPLTGMQFVEERFISGTPRLLFSQYLSYDRSGWVNVYSIATKDLDSLKAW